MSEPSTGAHFQSSTQLAMPPSEKVGMIAKRTIGTLLVSGLWGCAPDWGDKIPKSAPRGQLTLEPPAVANVSSRSVELWSSIGQTPRLFALALSESQIASVRRGEPSATVREHEVPLIEQPRPAESGAPLELSRFSPGGLLARATTHTAVAPSAQLKFMTAADEPVLLRAWPHDSVRGRAVFCAESNTGLAALGANPSQLWGTDRVWFVAGDAGVVFADGGVHAGEWSLLAGESACFFWHGEDDAAPPTRWNGFAVEPTLQTEREAERSDAGISSGATSAETLASCQADEVSVERGCVTVQDDRIIVRPTTLDTVWFITGDAQAWFVSEQGEPGVVRGLRANADFALHFSVFEPSGLHVESDLVGRTALANSHVVINEVFADPLGAEPRGEWIEIYNDGASVVDLHGWVLEDDGGRVELPSTQLAPLGYALLVNDTYERVAELDVVPDEDVFLIRLPSLGKSGLSNQGETLRLIHNSGMVVSSFPASPKPAPGVSVARREPWFVGAHPRGFGLHAAPFASPGKRNSIGVGN